MDRPFSLEPLLPTWTGNPVTRHALGLLERISGLRTLQNKYDQLPPCSTAVSFIESAFSSLGISYSVDGRTNRIPDSGPVIVVANHPFGAVDGMIMAHLLCGIRSDVRIMANYHLSRIPALRDLFLIVDPFHGSSAWKSNVKPLRESIRWLRNGGLLMVFPAGEVSHFHLGRRRVVDPAWSDTIGRLVHGCRVPVVPVCFHGRNSALFNLAGMLHASLRTILLPRELVGKSNSRIQVSLGKAIDYRKLTCFESPRELTDYLRLRCYLLESGDPLGRKKSVRLRLSRNRKRDCLPIHPPIDRISLRNEIDALPDDALLHTSGKFAVYIARAEAIPRTLQEIGRLREMTFRDAGEGTGRATDIDLFDTWYRHLFIWNWQTDEVVGAYRLGLVREILAGRGSKGLYSRTLFRYRKSLLEEFEPALELGRSFVRVEYQRSFQALGLLWKGIGRIAFNENLAVLFGPVSISRQYSDSSRRLIAGCLQQGEFRSHLAPMVRPRRSLKDRFGHGVLPVDVGLATNLELVSDIVSQFEEDDKGLPVLVRQYLKMGGQFLGFNLDTEFSDVVDGLVMVDLRRCDPKILARYMGSENATIYLERIRNGHP